MAKKTAKTETAAPQQQTQASFRPIGQYVKDFSFECPKAPMLTPENERNMDINIGINAAELNAERGLYEVTLAVRARAEDSAKVTVFMAELAYSGVFEALNIPKEQLPAILNIDGPSLLFPYARQVLLSMLAESGFTPPMLEPVNFAALYAQQMQQQKDNQTEKASN